MTEQTDQQPKQKCSICNGTGLTGTGQHWDDGFSECASCIDGYVEIKQEHQPDCPAEYGRPKSSFGRTQNCVGCDDYMLPSEHELCANCRDADKYAEAKDELTTLRAENERLQARVGELKNELAFADALIISDLKNEAWADTETVKKARALLAGLGPVVDELDFFKVPLNEVGVKSRDYITGAFNSASEGDDVLLAAVLEERQIDTWALGGMFSVLRRTENLHVLLTTIRQLGDVLGVKKDG